MRSIWRRAIALTLGVAFGDTSEMTMSHKDGKRANLTRDAMRTRDLVRASLSAIFAGAVFGVASATAAAQGTSSAPADVSHLQIPSGTFVEPSLRRPLGSGTVDVVVRMTGPSVAQAAGPNATKGQGQLNAAGQRARLAQVGREQDAISQAAAALGGKELGRVGRALNAVVVRIDRSKVAALAAQPGVASVRPLRNYEMDLSETVPYIGARSGRFSQPGGANGTGVKVAVLDSGIDYTHANLGGPGTLAAYEAAWGTSTSDPRNTTTDGLFPTAKVIGGYDFVGESWPNTPEAPDPDPIDYEGHGTHVSDIIAGSDGVAPGARLLAVKVCSAVATSCSGLALLQGMDFALDPNGDGDISDAVDVINMSLGSSFGQIEDDLSLAAQNAVNAGVTVVTSAGNSADRPYIVGSPSSTPGVISVAQSQVPSAVSYPLVVTGISPSTINNTALVDWAPVGAGFSGQVVRLGRGCPAGSIDGANPADPYFNGNNPAGKVALIDRGACSVSLKVDRAAKAGAIAVLIANNASGDPPSFSFGGGDTFVPTIVITQADGNRIKSALGATGVNPAVVASVSPAVSIPLVGSMVGSSSRGPSMSFDAIKPDIAAPGASVSAVAGSGTGTQAFGGTSGAAPMVSGSAALLLSLDRSMDPLTVKARLMATAETNVLTNPATQPGVLAPITRIGGGEVRVDKAAAATTIAYDTTPGSSGQPSLSFGFHTLAATATLERRLTIRNLGSQTRTYTVTPSFRYANDAASGAVVPSIVGGNTVSIGAGKERAVTVRLVIDPSKLPAWPFTFAPSQLGNGSLLNGPEYDGYLTLSSAGEHVHVPWHVLPRAAANVTANRPIVNLASNQPTVTLSNTGAIDGEWSAFALTGTSRQIPPGLLPDAGENLAAIDLKSVGVRDAGSGYLQFAVNTWDERSHPAYPGGFEIQVDADRDGTPDWFVYNAEQTSFAATGVVLVYVVNAQGTGGAYFFLDADLNSSNRVFTVPLSAMGLTATTAFDFTVVAYDNYFSGLVTDSIGPMRYTPGTPRYVFGGALGDGTLGKGQSGTVPVTAVAGGAQASPSQSGVLLMHYGAPQGREATTIEVRP